MQENTIRGTVLAVMFALLAGPLLNPAAAERDPYHVHIVIGGDAAARQRALAEHRHGQAPADASTTYDDNGVRVLSIGSLGAVGPLVLGISALAAAAASAARLVSPTPRAKVPVCAFLLVANPTLPVPEPPPRSA